MKKEWLIAGVIAGCLGGGGLGACGGSSGAGGSGVGASTSTTGSPSSTTGTPAGTTTSGTPAGTTTTTTSGGGATTVTTSGGGTSVTGGGGSTTGTGGEGGSTCKTPGTLHPPNLEAGPGTIYCPFSGVDGGKAEYCTPQTQHCCETPEGSTTPSACVDGITTACVAGSVDWQCEDPVADCAAGEVCCAAGASIGLGGMVGGMACQNFAHHMTGTACVAASACPAASNIVICTNNTECTGIGTGTCTPFSKSGNAVGGCM
jgi:hypothetical protein